MSKLKLAKARSYVSPREIIRSLERRERALINSYKLLTTKDKPNDLAWTEEQFFAELRGIQGALKLLSRKHQKKFSWLRIEKSNKG